MPFHFKALILVMVITLIMFALAKPLFTRFMAVEDFTRRRNLWIVLTLAAFFIPDFWAFMAVATLIVGYGVAKDPNPAALYMFLLLAIPPLRLEIPGFGIANYIFGLDHLRLLSLVLLLPVALRMIGAADPYRLRSEAGLTARGLQTADVLLLLYVALQVGLSFPYESVTASMRRILVTGIDTLLPYFVLSRVCRNRETIVEAMASFALAVILLAPLAVVEMNRGWILYAGLEERWGAAHMIGYLTRGDYLRAQVTAGHAIVLGYAMAVGLGCWLFLQTRLPGRGWRWLGLLTLVAGLGATLARGPWIGGVAAVVVFLALGPNAAHRTAKALAVLAVFAVVAVVTPLGTQIIEHLPFIGSMDAGSVSYRQRLAEMSWLLIMQNPWLGSPSYLKYMGELRQGEGIVDIVNVYAAVALSYGLVGLGLLLGFFATIGIKCLRVSRRFAPQDADFASLGAGLLACLAGALVILATTSNYLSVPYIYWAFAAFAFAYVRMAPAEEAASADAEPPLAHRPIFQGRVSSG